MQAEPRSFDDLGELPYSYGSDTVFLAAQDPHRIFTYWDIDISKHPGGAAFLRYFRNETELEGQIEVPFETRNWYIPVERANTEYVVEIGYFRGDEWHLIGKSMPVKTPPEGVSPSDEFAFATVPFHLSFQRMVERVENAARAGEDLLGAVSRMQREGDFTAFGSQTGLEALASDPRALIAGLLGPDFLDELASSGLSSAQIESQIRVRLEEMLSSGGASEWVEVLSSFGLTGASLGKAEFGSGAFSSAALSSAEFGSGASWSAAFSSSEFWSGGFASWAAAELAAVLSSWSGASSWSESIFVGSSETTSWISGASWLQALSSSWGAGAISSFGESSWGGASESLASWLQAGQTSWAQAALSSWSSFESASWFSALAESSWGGASESLSSFGIERSFFMHVNAEVIFYGGTDPRAKVTIDGSEVELDESGNFRFHFVFPNADYEIPIIATSPDGLETRSATLRFCRETGKVGFVTDTLQPPLGEPMGRR